LHTVNSLRAITLALNLVDEPKGNRFGPLLSPLLTGNPLRQ